MNDSITKVPDCPIAGLAGLLFVISVSASACGRTPPPPYHLNASFAGSTTRAMIARSETAVPLTVINTGDRTWDPARTHLSYHWLWLLPREITSRSRWNVPYQNGIRTDLPHPVSPGDRVDVQARLLAPEWPGLYWRQWDMVEEGVTWFAQVAPRQSRELILVLPPVVWLAAPLPFLVAVAGVVAIRRRRGSLAIVADVVWCAAALAAKPLVIVHDARLEPTAAGYWLIVVTAVVPAAVALFLPRRVRAWLLFGVGTFGSLTVLADVVYYRFFGDVLSTPALLAAGQAGHVWGSIRSLLSPLLIWLVIDLPIAAWIAVRISAAHSPAPSLVHRARTAGVACGALVVSGLALSVPSSFASRSLDQMFRDRAVVEQLGVFGFHAFDTWNYARSTLLRRPATDAEVREAADWFRTRAPMRTAKTAPTFGTARGRNLIVLQVESLQDFVVDFRVAGQDVMPHLRRWEETSLRFTNVTDQTSEGRTSDAEFTTMTSLLPLDHGAVAFRYPGNHYTALPRVLADEGYTTLSAVPFEPGFWNRRVMHPSYGFQQTLFEPDFEMTEQIGWGLNDHDFLQQMVPRLASLQRPFAAWLITLSLHHPFDDFPKRHKTLKLGPLEGTSFGNYLHTMHFFDEALDAFTTSLEQRSLLDSSVIVIFGDHDAGFARDAALSRTIGIGSDDASWTMNDRIPLFVHVPGSPAALRGRRDTPAGQTDVAPTLLSLLGFDAAPLAYVGRDLLGSPAGPVLRPYGEWLDEHHLLVTRATAPVCRVLEPVAEASAGCTDVDRVARRDREIARLVVAADLQAKLSEVLRRTTR